MSRRTESDDRALSLWLRAEATVPSEAYDALLRAYEELDREACQVRRDLRQMRRAWHVALLVALVNVIIATWIAGRAVEAGEIESNDLAAHAPVWPGGFPTC